MTAPRDSSAADALRDALFPPPPAAHARVSRVDLVGSWESQFVGLSRLLQCLSRDLLVRVHAADDAALSVVFLQRHRIEVGLKLLLERAGGLTDVLRAHDLDRLFAHAQRRCGSVDQTAWQGTMAGQRPFVRVMQEIDPNSATFRYPVDTTNAGWARGPLVDLAALQDAGERYAGAVEAMTQALDQHEALPEIEDAGQVAQELWSMARLCEHSVHIQRRITADPEAATDHLTGQSKRDRDNNAYTVSADALEVTLALAARATKFAQRFADEHGLALQAVQLCDYSEPPPIGPMPSPSSLAAWTGQQRRGSAELFHAAMLRREH